jgi:hypothetical protein
MGAQRFKLGLVIDNTEKRYLAVDGAILVDAFEGALKDWGWLIVTTRQRKLSPTTS